jgi:hypothetical protein
MALHNAWLTHIKVQSLYVLCRAKLLSSSLKILLSIPITQHTSNKNHSHYPVWNS